MNYTPFLSYQSTLGNIEPNSAAYYLDATLKALIPVDIYNYPNGSITRTAETGSLVGEIRSWVERNGVVWWELKEGGFVPHASGKFDATIATNTSQGKGDDILDLFMNPSGGFDFLPDAEQFKKIAIIGGVSIAAVIGVKAFLDYRNAKKLADKLSKK